ncbi:MAG: ABC transporter ATP-binding protein [Endomicrobium sp.]|jgi:lipoprotein-releasing system ATP-binding protein|nr:ABC transporter ATP-binding protein [Endomicrobium sp.]MDR2399509.1 ABC transporter ATP-binding protein [Endomicrobium sp.]
MIIKTENLNKRYSKKDSADVKVLNNINLEIRAGEKVALIGPSGAGKSTLIHILGLMDRPTSGKVYIDGLDCFSKDDKFLRSIRKISIGFVFQFHYLMPDFTVLENILIPVWKDKESKSKQAQDILSKSGLLHRKDHYPSELSGGEQQRVAIARALINNPRIIFADEPTGNLDRHTGIEIEKLLFDSADVLGSTLVFVTHNEDLAKKSDRTIRLDDGFIV